MQKRDKIFDPCTEYLEVLYEYLRGIRDTPYYEAVRESHLNDERFLYWVGRIERYKPIEKASVRDIGCGSGGILVAPFINLIEKHILNVVNYYKGWLFHGKIG